MPTSLIFRENAKALRFDALIEKKIFMYKSNGGPRRTIQLNPKPSLGEKLAKTPGSRARPILRLGLDRAQ